MKIYVCLNLGDPIVYYNTERADVLPYKLVVTVGGRRAIHKIMQHQEHHDCERAVPGTNIVCPPRRNYNRRRLQQSQV